MIWLLRDIDLLGTLLRAADLSFEALLLGGVLFLLAVARESVRSFCLRGIRAAALALALAEVITVALSSASLLGDSGLGLGDLINTVFFQAGMSAALLAALMWLSARSNKYISALVPLGLLLLIATISTSHAAAHMNHRLFLGAATGVHHVATAAWIGAMPFLLLSLGRAGNVEEARVMVQRYSVMALVSVPLLIVAGVGMAWLYVGSWSGLYGTSYGVLLLAKIYLLVIMLAMGGGNWWVVRQLHTNPQPLLLRLRRFAEAEVGLGFTAILAAASMSAQPPAVDVPDQVSAHVIVRRLQPSLPRLTSPSVAQLTPATSIESAVRENEFQANGGSDARDHQWSEYNHTGPG